MNALLVYPRFPVTYWGFQYGLRLIGKRAALPPLGLITVAALLPGHWHVRLVDLNVDALHDDDLRWADIVLTGGLLIQAESMQVIIVRARAFHCPVAVGGPAPTTSPDLFGDADVVFQGEAENRIDDLVRALARRSGSCLVLEAPSRFPDMSCVPVPRFDMVEAGFTSVFLGIETPSVKSMSRCRSRIRQAVAHAVQGEYFILYTCEHVVPRMKRALAKIHAGIEHDPRPLSILSSGVDQ